MRRCIGFIECTKMKVEIPFGGSVNQRCASFCHKRYHCLVYQSITSPVGLMFKMYGTLEGRCHDLTFFGRVDGTMS